MRISDWSSDVCSSDLGRGSYRSLYLDFRAVGLLHRAQAHLRIHIQDQADDAEEAEAAGDACRRHDRALSEGRAGTLTTALRTVSEGQSRMSRTVAVVGAGIVGVCTALTLQEAGYAVTLLDPAPIGSQKIGRAHV